MPRCYISHYVHKPTRTHHTYPWVSSVQTKFVPVRTHSHIFISYQSKLLVLLYCCFVVCETKKFLLKFHSCACRCFGLDICITNATPFCIEFNYLLFLYIVAFKNGCC